MKSCNGIPSANHRGVLCPKCSYGGIWDNSLHVAVCGNEIDFKDVNEKSHVCAQRLKNFRMVGAYQCAASLSPRIWNSLCVQK